MSNKTILDANAVIHYILDDIPAQTAAVREILNRREVLILPEVMEEVIHVFRGVYKKTKVETATVLKDFLYDIRYEHYPLMFALTLYETSSLDFVDCMLCTYSYIHKVLTFDKKLNKLIDRTALKRQNAKGGEQ